MAIKQNGLTKKDEVEIERLRRSIKENERRLHSNLTAKDELLSEAQQENLRKIVDAQRTNLNAITNRLDIEPDPA